MRSPQRRPGRQQPSVSSRVATSAPSADIRRSLGPDGRSSAPFSSSHSVSMICWRNLSGPQIRPFHLLSECFSAGKRPSPKIQVNWNLSSAPSRFAGSPCGRPSPRTASRWLPPMMVEAISTRGLAPRDVALRFGGAAPAPSDSRPKFRWYQRPPRRSPPSHEDTRQPATIPNSLWSQRQPGSSDRSVNR